MDALNQNHSFSFNLYLCAMNPPMTTVGDKKVQIRTMFDRIAPRYDFLNHLLSGGIDRRWRRKVISHLQEKNPGRILDMATGTGDLAILMGRAFPTAQIEGRDISGEMIRLGQAKVEKSKQKAVNLDVGDAENIQFSDQHFDAVTVAFGVRNFEDLGKGLREMYRVLRPGGRLVVLEFSQPRGRIFRPLFLFYFKNILPFYGKLISKDPMAYRYLFESVQSFPAYEKFMKELQSAGFQTRYYRELTFGICTIYVADR